MIKYQIEQKLAFSSELKKLRYVIFKFFRAILKESMFSTILLPVSSSSSSSIPLCLVKVFWWNLDYTIHRHGIKRLSHILKTHLFLILQSVTRRSNHRRYSIQKGVLKNFVKFPGKHLSQNLIFDKFADWGNLIKKEALRLMFSYHFCEIFQEHLFVHNTTKRMLLDTQITASYNNS